MTTRITRRKAHRAESLKGLLYIAPAVLLVLLFFVMPLALTFWMSLHNWPLMGSPKWVGLKNYVIMASDSQFLAALGFTALYTGVVTVAIFVVAFPLAILLEKPRPWVAFYRTSVFLPVVVGLGSASFLWTWLANVDAGLFGPLLRAVGLVETAPNLMAGFGSAFSVIVVMVVWKIAGFTMIILMTGLQGIPTELVEASRIDGASAPKRFFYLTLPLMRRTIALALVVSVTGSVLAFDQFYIMTSGGPQNRMISVVYYIFNQSFVSFRLGYGAALSIVLLGVLLLISMVQLWLLREKGDK